MKKVKVFITFLIITFLLGICAGGLIIKMEFPHFGCSRPIEAEKPEMATQAEFSKLQEELAKLRGEIALFQGEVDWLKEQRLLPCAQNHEWLLIEKRVRVLGSEDWADSVRISPETKIEFLIEVASQGILSNVTVKDILPPQFRLQKGSLRIDGSLAAGDIVAGLNIGSLRPGQKVTITFEAQISERFYGTTSLINVVRVWADCVEEKTADAIVEVLYPPSYDGGGGNGGVPGGDGCAGGGPGGDAP